VRTVSCVRVRMCVCVRSLRFARTLEQGDIFKQRVEVCHFPGEMR